MALTCIGAGGNAGGGQGSGGGDKKLKVDPTKLFNGKSKDLANFLFMLKVYLDVKDITSDSKKTTFVATRFKGNALVWWRSVYAAGTFD